MPTENDDPSGKAKKRFVRDNFFDDRLASIFSANEPKSLEFVNVSALLWFIITKNVDIATNALRINIFEVKVRSWKKDSSSESEITGLNQLEIILNRIDCAILPYKAADFRSMRCV